MSLNRTSVTWQWYGPDDDAFRGGSARSVVFNRVNWERRHRAPARGWWTGTERRRCSARGGHTDGVLGVAGLGSQAESPISISADYHRWVNRSMAWVRRRGVKVWGLEPTDRAGDVDVTLPILNSVFALPGAMAALRAGDRGRHYCASVARERCFVGT